MARPQPTKPSVDLASLTPAKSRIRRDPPAPAKKTELVVDPEEREQWTVIVGVLAFALAIFVITIAFASYAGWSPSDYTVEMRGD